MKKTELMDKINSFISTLFPEEKKEETKVEQKSENNEVKAEKETILEEEKPVEEPVAPEFKVGEPLPDGEYVIGDQILVIKDGKIESILSKMNEETEMKKEEKPVETKLSSEDYSKKLEDFKKAMELKLSDIAASVKSSGIKQIPTEKEAPKESLKTMDIMLKEIEEKIK